LGLVTSDYISRGLGWVGLQKMDPRPCLGRADKSEDYCPIPYGRGRNDLHNFAGGG